MSVNTPAAAQTSSMPDTDGTAPDTSDGWTKIEAPMIVPTTIAVARVRPIACRRPPGGVEEVRLWPFGRRDQREVWITSQYDWIRPSVNACTCSAIDASMVRDRGPGVPV